MSYLTCRIGGWSDRGEEVIKIDGLRKLRLKLRPGEANVMKSLVKTSAAISHTVIHAITESPAGYVWWKS